MYEAEYFSKNCPLLIKTKKCHRSRIPMKDFRILFCIRSNVCDWTLLDHQIDAEKPAKMWRFQKCALFSKILMPSVVWKPYNKITWKYFYEKITFWINSRFLECSEYWKTERAGSEFNAQSEQWVKYRIVGDSKMCLSCLYYAKSCLWMIYQTYIIFFSKF